MNVFVLGLIVACSALSCSAAETWSDEQTQRIQKYRQECITETKVNPEFIDRADKGDFVEDSNLKCFAKCFYEKAGFINENGDLLLDVIKSKIPDANKEKAFAAVEKCKVLKGSDNCETVFLVHKCYFENTPHPELEKAQQAHPDPPATSTQ